MAHIAAHAARRLPLRAARSRDRRGERSSRVNDTTRPYDHGPWAGFHTRRRLIGVQTRAYPATATPSIDDPSRDFHRLLRVHAKAAMEFVSGDDLQLVHISITRADISGLS